MSSESFTHIEQDKRPPDGGDQLPTYDDLAAQNGPNSRFGRWRGWIEKRAAERYYDISPAERSRRRERGWGNEDMDEHDASQSVSTPLIRTEPATPSLYIQTNGFSSSIPTPISRPASPPLPPPFISQRISPTHLKINHFGSRFLPHTTSPIRCLLPLMAEKLLLIGHDEGLSVLELYPHEWDDLGGISLKGPEEAQARSVWKGESVLQMNILEVENLGDGVPQGVVLILVGPESDSPGGKDQDCLRTLRMYNLASLSSLARWAVSQKGAHPLDLSRQCSLQTQQTSIRRHRHQGSIARSLKNFIDAPQPSYPTPNVPYRPQLSPFPPGSSNPSISPSPGRLSPNRRGSGESSWDVVEDLPLRWATDFVPLAANGSRLGNTSIISYALWNDDHRQGRGGQVLAVATKTAILLYETPKGSEFYTPMTPRHVTFFQQLVQDTYRTSPELSPSRSSHHRRSDSSITIRPDQSRGPSPNPTTYGTHLSLFVTFEKKASWIRIADSAVGEIELFDPGNASNQSRTQRDSFLPLSPVSTRKLRRSFDGRDSSTRWVPPTRCEFPLGGPFGGTQVYLFTKGKQTHILPCPLPTSPSPYPPMRIISWGSPPAHVSPRVSPQSPPGSLGAAFLQLVAFGEHGLEVQEISLSFLNPKGKEAEEEPVRAEDELGGDAGFLSTGGHWDLLGQPPAHHGLSRTYSATSELSALSLDSVESADILAKLKQNEGIYGWCRKGLEDYRVFWVGGPLNKEYEEDP
ncbi:hypothetical protein BD779DRAFT_1608371 [Infundibulicybe gibba]|nr:hypothetical protein BD779DRAFT_1608371 [Infundibulicybe gibba]